MAETRVVNLCEFKVLRFWKKEQPSLKKVIKWQCDTKNPPQKQILWNSICSSCLWSSGAAAAATQSLARSRCLHFFFSFNFELDLIKQKTSAPITFPLSLHFKHSASMHVRPFSLGSELVCWESAWWSVFTQTAECPLVFIIWPQRLKLHVCRMFLDLTLLFFLFFGIFFRMKRQLATQL